MAEETGITVLRGEPDATELAAVTTVLLALLRQGATSPQEPGPARYADWSVRGAAGPVPVSWAARERRRTL